jgi:hypothetical protein
MSGELPRGLKRAAVFVGIGWRMQQMRQSRHRSIGGVVTGHIARADIVQRGGPLAGTGLRGKLRWQQRDAVLRIEPDAPH